MPRREAPGAPSSADAGTLDLQPQELRECTHLWCKAAQGAVLRRTADDRRCVCSTGQGMGFSVYRLPFKLLKTMPFGSNQGVESMHPWISGDAPGPLTSPQAQAEAGGCVPATPGPWPAVPILLPKPRVPMGTPTGGSAREAEGWGQVTP